MGRLVDEDDVKNWLQERIEGYKQLNCGGNNRSAELEVIKEELAIRVPTVYDTDKVVKQLKERTAFLNDCTKYGNNTAEQQDKSYGTMMMYEVKDLVDDLLEIVKGGGTDGN